jgi:hypothetical protein
VPVCFEPCFLIRLSGRCSGVYVDLVVVSLKISAHNFQKFMTQKKR